MNKEIILDALEAAKSLIESEFESLLIEEMKEDYKEVLNKIQDALTELR